MIKILFLNLAMYSAYAADPYWYGTVNFTKSIKTSVTTTYSEGDVFYPGVLLETVDRHWSGVVRYLPGKKSIISARYTGSIISDRKTDTMHDCSWKNEPTEYHDYQLVESKTNFSTNREVSGDMYLRIQEDGSYKASGFASGGKQVEDANKTHIRRERFNACSTPSLNVNDEITSDSDGMESVKFEIKGIADPNAETLTGHWSGKDIDGGDLEYSWDLTLIDPKLVARIDGPTTIERAQVITLDASRSTGKIKDYSWGFVPNDDCTMTPSGASIKLKGKKVSFVALCDFTAYLDVEDETEINTAEILVNVSAREGDSWKTKFNTKAGPNFTARIISNGIPLGINQCALHGSGADQTGHFMHTDDIATKTWKDSGYKMIQVNDSGPFQGSWYIDTQSLKVDRMERINTNILPGGEVYKINAKHSNLADIQALATQIKAHEKMHSTLLEQELLRLGHDGDAAVKIEKLVFPNDELLQEKADFEVRMVNSFLYDATSDEKVQNGLHSTGSFNKSVKIWVPLADDDNDPTNNPDFLKDMGTLWSIGDR